MGDTGSLDFGLCVLSFLAIKYSQYNWMSPRIPKVLSDCFQYADCPGIRRDPCGDGSCSQARALNCYRQEPYSIMFLVMGFTLKKGDDNDSLISLCLVCGEYSVGSVVDNTVMLWRILLCGWD